MSSLKWRVSTQRPLYDLPSLIRRHGRHLRG